MKNCNPFTKCAFLMMLIAISSCKQDDEAMGKAECGWDSKITDRCLLSSQENSFYEYKADTVYFVHSPNSPFRYFYTNRLLVSYALPVAPKNVSGIHYEYNSCNQLVRSVQANWRDPYGSSMIGKFTHSRNGRLNRIDYIDSSSSQIIPAGYELYNYTPTLNTVYRFDALNGLVSWDSIVLDGMNNIIEYWWMSYSGGFESLTRQIPITPRVSLNIAKVGDRLEYYYKNVISSKTVVDSVFYNEYGFDTLVYSSDRFADGTFHGIYKRVRTCTDCRF